VDARILVGAMMLRDELAKAALDTKEPALHIPQQRKGKTVRSWCEGCDFRRRLGVCDKEESCINGSERTASPVA